MRVVLDASVFIDFLRRPESEKLLSRKIIEKEYLIFSLVTVAELYSGKSVWEEGKARELLLKVLETAEIVIPSFEDAREVGKLRAAYQISLGDAFVAQLAIQRNYPLATLDKKAFGEIARLKLYSLKR